MVVHLENDTFAIDTALCFRSVPFAGIYGTVQDVTSDILHSLEGIGPISSWVNDHLFFRIWCSFLPEYNRMQRKWNRDITLRGKHHEGSRIWFGGQRLEDGTLEEFNEDCAFSCRDLSMNSVWSTENNLYTYNFEDIDTTSQRLGIPWEVSKDRQFASSTTYIGFNWNIEMHQVSLAVSKKEKFLKIMQEWLNQPTHILRDMEKLHSELLHTCLVIPIGQAYLSELECMLKIFHSSPLIPHSSPKGLQVDLKWWITVLQQPTITRTNSWPVSLYNAQVFLDASLEFGIAITVGNMWRAWWLIPGWQILDRKHNIGWAKVVAFKCLTRHLTNNGG